MNEEDVQNSHPGPITNDEDLTSPDSQINLKGTGTLEQFERSTVDKYVRDDVRETLNYKLVSQELWTFLHSKYGGSEIKRFSIPQSYYTNTVEVRYKLIPIVILPSSRLLQGGSVL